MIQIENLSKRFGAHFTLRDFCRIVVTSTGHLSPSTASGGMQ
jgi:hypothetical protein